MAEHIFKKNLSTAILQNIDEYKLNVHTANQEEYTIEKLEDSIFNNLAFDCYIQVKDAKYTCTEVKFIVLLLIKLKHKMNFVLH